MNKNNITLMKEINKINDDVNLVQIGIQRVAKNSILTKSNITRKIARRQISNEFS